MQEGILRRDKKKIVWMNPFKRFYPTKLDHRGYLVATKKAFNPFKSGYDTPEEAYKDSEPVEITRGEYYFPDYEEAYFVKETNDYIILTDEYDFRDKTTDGRIPSEKAIEE